ncbi:hypothetical protein Rsub_09339 [Raphidocelis subcapitata]|uniref:Rhodanese domain-containing protein n=1 Tax=Raphidocelis subcapitata TaxID=307507 RepID=A0A2V0PFA7_9CHLO|nr:hypothetical protein Rsub_09339 [Raphidocelis subcapitata]|eukprot:GBF96593.1 hypothetical protein Rsub_09339 [Raphidocelis subcapitata]
MALLQREGWKVLDIREARAYEDGRITKPARCSFNAPWGGDAGAVAAKAASLLPNPGAAKLLVMAADGGGDGAAAAAAAAAALAAKGFGSVAVLEGGYAAWTQIWSPSGKRRPPAGRWVPTGKEALKAGTNLEGVAESYDEGGNLAKSRYAAEAAKRAAAGGGAQQ